MAPERIIVALTLVLLAGCAVPIPPAGGPPDRDPPFIISSTPQDKSVNVTTTEVVVEFNEFIDGRSAATAVTITPELDRRPDISARGKSVRIRFPEELRDNTTYIIAFEQGLRDANGVALTSPISVAFSTGPVINAHFLSGKAVLATTGVGVQGLDIYAYITPDSLPPGTLPVSPEYRTQTDDEGNFTLRYLPDLPMFVLGLADANRNRMPDAGEAVGFPPRAVVRPDSIGALFSEPWLVHLPDTTAPELRRVTSASNSRFQLRFSEPVVLGSLGAASVSISDSAGTGAFPIERAGIALSDAREVIVRTAPLAPGEYAVTVAGALADTSGNPVRPATMPVQVAERADTTQARFLAFSADTVSAGVPGLRVLAPWAEPTLSFSDAPDLAQVRAALSVSDTARSAIPFELLSRNGRDLDLQTTWPAGGLLVTLDLAQFGADDSTITAGFGLAQGRVLGELAGVVADPDSANLVVELIPLGAGQEPTRRQKVSGAFVFDRLPDGRPYRLRLIEDRDGDGRWNAGSLFPFSAPERLQWFEAPEKVRARWEVVLPDTLRLSPEGAR